MYLYLEERRIPALAGVALAAVSLKPQVGALFLLIPLFRRDWTTLSIAAFLNISASVAASLLLSKNPLELVRAMAQEGASYTDAYLGAFDLLRRVGVSTTTILALGMTAGVLGAIFVLAKYRERPPRVLVGVIACVTTLWTYQRTMDLLILGFLVGPLAVRAYRTQSRRDWAVFLFVGASYWFPYLVRMAAMPFVPEIFRVVWVFGAIQLLRDDEPFAIRVPRLDLPST
jgi:hypothetical protein